MNFEFYYTSMVQVGFKDIVTISNQNTKVTLYQNVGSKDFSEGKSLIIRQLENLDKARPYFSLTSNHTSSGRSKVFVYVTGGGDLYKSISHNVTL